MVRISNQELNDISGGISKFWYLAAGIGTFIVSIIAGIINPKSCNR